MDTSKVPEEVSQYTWDVINKMPDDFVIEGGTESVESVMIRGKLGVWAITVKYDFVADEVHLHAMSTGLREKSGVVKFADFADAIEKEFQNGGVPPSYNNQ
jgi:hypothetical protein